MMDVSPRDRMYNCLPMYHSVGGVLADRRRSRRRRLGGDRPQIFRQPSSGSDIVGWDCTLFQYIGELCRYLLHSAAASA